MSLLIRVCHLSKMTFMCCHVLGGQMGGCHSSLGCHLSKITFMFCHVLWGQTGVSLLIRVSFVKNHIYVLSCIVGTDGGVTPH